MIVVRSLPDEVEWRTGLFFTHERTVDLQDMATFDAGTGTPIALPTLLHVSVGPALFTEWAGYGDLTWHATDRFSVADITAVVAVDFARVVKHKPSEQHPHLLRWRAAMAQRPSMAL